jgi:hypothetical protein
MECKYHNILEKIHEVLWVRINNHYDWEFFDYWLGDESNLSGCYKDTFEEFIEEPLTEAQNALLEKKGSNLEKMIGNWCYKWKKNNPELDNEKLPKSCLKVKIYEYIIYQLNKADIRQIIGNPC